MLAATDLFLDGAPRGGARQAAAALQTDNE
jgi:hypothetical protein